MDYLFHRLPCSQHAVRACLLAQLVKNLPAIQETQVWSLEQGDLLEKDMATHSSILTGGIPWTEEPDELQSMGSQRVRHNWMTNTHTRRHTTPSRTNTYKKCPFHHRGLECKNRKSRDTQNNKQVCPWHTKWEVLLGKHAGHSKYPFPTIRETTLHVDITRWSIPKSY